MSDADFTISRHGEADPRLAFSRKLQALTTRIHATGSLDEIMLDLGMDICDLFNCDRYTLYTMDHEKDYIVSKVKTGLTTFRDLKLAVTPHSIAGYVALTHQTVNIADVYDDDELKRLSSELRFQQGVDQRTGYRTRAMLLAPLIGVQSRELLGVVQFTNHREGGPFPQLAVDGVGELCETLAVALSQRMKASRHVRTKHDGLMADAVPTAADMDGHDEEGDSQAAVSAEVDNDMVNLVNLVNKIIVDACRQGASAIHIEPLAGEGKTGVRFRKDGALAPYLEIPASYRAALVERVKTMCGLDVAERRQPQEGKIEFREYGPLDIALRVTTIPSAGGVEDVVLRILAARENVSLDQLGMLPFNLDRLRATVEKPYGLFLVCGPGDSGKTTTLHAVLNHLNTPATKIWSVEDPVEVTQQGVRQAQVDRNTGQDSTTVMRALLRADADVIMVEAMGDKDAAGMSIEAALAGHLVCSALHTHSAPEAVARLLDMGVDPFKLGDALLGVLAQRLARRLCPACKQAYHPAGMELDLLLTEYCEELNNSATFSQDARAGRAAVLAGWRGRYADKDGKFTLYRAVGCDACQRGYRGRIGLHELLVVSDKVRQLLPERARMAQLRAAALEDGMPTLRMDGIEKILLGHTDIKMVRAVCVK